MASNHQQQMNGVTRPRAVVRPRPVATRSNQTTQAQSEPAPPVPAAPTFSLPSPTIALPTTETVEAIPSPPPAYIPDEPTAPAPARSRSLTGSSPQHVVTHSLTPVAPRPEKPARVTRFVERFDHETDPVDLARYL